LDILNDIPGYLEMAGYVEDGHVVREFEGVPLEGPGIGEAGIGKAEIDLTNRLAASPRNPLYVEVQKAHLRSYGHHAEPSRRTSPEDEIFAPACRATKFVSLVFDGKDDLALLI